MTTISIKGRRVTQFDAVRGIAMLAMCLSHSGELVLRYGLLNSALRTIGLVATPTFLLLSGVVCGYMAGTSASADLRWRWLDRGLFMLLVGHFALGLTMVATARMAPIAATFDSVYITDATGIALICGACGLINVSKSKLVLFGAILCGGSGMLSYYFTPQSVFASSLERALVGVSGDTFAESYVVPIVPYLGIFMIGLAGGKHYRDLLVRRVDVRRIAYGCLLIGAISMLLAVGFKLVGIGLHSHVPVEWRKYAHDLTAFRQKIPPSVNYILTFGGAAMFITGIVGLSKPGSRSAHVLSILADFGQASFFIFVFQFWLYYFPAMVMGIGPLPWHGFAIYVALSWYALWCVARSWSRIDGNRFFTVGARHLRELLSHLPAVNLNRRSGS